MRLPLPALALLIATGTVAGVVGELVVGSLGVGPACPPLAAETDEPVPPALPGPPATSAPAAAAPRTTDVLHLTDGRRLEGAVIAETAEAITFRSGGATRMYLRADVDHLDRAAALAAPEGSGSPGSTDRTGGPSADRGQGGVPGAKPAAKGDSKKKDPIGKKGKVLTEEARHWVRDLALQAAVEDEQVRRSVAAALRALGPAAVPSIEAAAAAAATPSARDFLVRVAADMAPKRDPAPGGPPPKGDAMQPGPTPGDPSTAVPGGAVPGTPEPARGPGATGPDSQGAPREPKPGAGRAGRGAGKLLEELELREDQRPRMAEILGALERRQLGLLRELRQGGIAPDGVAGRIDALRTETLGAAKAVLDTAQFDLFEERAGRYFDGLLVRATRGDANPAPPPAPPPGVPAPPEVAPPK